jgi:hypothetical protein
MSARRTASPVPPKSAAVDRRDAEELAEALTELQVEIIEAADRIDHLDHRLNDGRVIAGKTILGGTEIQDECQGLRKLARDDSALSRFRSKYPKEEQ